VLKAGTARGRRRDSQAAAAAAAAQPVAAVETPAVGHCAVARVADYARVHAACGSSASTAAIIYREAATQRGRRRRHERQAVC